jgi:hypothetical protein
LCPSLQSPNEYRAHEVFMFFCFCKGINVRKERAVMYMCMFVEKIEIRHISGLAGF